MNEENCQIKILKEIKPERLLDKSGFTNKSLVSSVTDIVVWLVLDAETLPKKDLR